MTLPATVANLSLQLPLYVSLRSVPALASPSQNFVPCTYIDLLYIPDQLLTTLSGLRITIRGIFVALKVSLLSRAGKVCTHAPIDCLLLSQASIQVPFVFIALHGYMNLGSCI